MDFIIYIVYFFILLVIKGKVRDRVSRLLIFVYSSYWCASLLICYYNPYGLFKVQNSTYILLIIHLLAFLFGFVIVRPGNIKINKAKLDIQSLLNNYVFIVLFFSCLVFSIVLGYRQREALAYLSLSDVRGDLMDIVLEGDERLSLFYKIVVTPVFHFCMCLLFYMLFFYRKWFVILFFLVFEVAFAYIGGGRNQFMTFGYYALSIFILADAINSSLKGEKTKFIFDTQLKVVFGALVTIAVSGMIVLTQLRKEIDNQGEGAALLGKTIVDYSTGPIVALDYSLKHEKMYFKNYYYGLATINGTEKFFSKFLYKLTGEKSDRVYESTTAYLQNNRIFISTESSWNFAYTSCIYYYWDFGLLGIVLWPFVIGLIVRSMIKYLYSRLDLYSISAFSFCTYCMCMSVFTGVITKQFALLYIMILIFLSYRTRWGQIAVNK